MNTQKLTLAIQKSGRLSDGSKDLLKLCGIKVGNGSNQFKAVAEGFPLEILLLRDDDIPQYVADGVADIGILGMNEVLEKKKEVKVIRNPWLFALPPVGGFTPKCRVHRPQLPARQAHCHLLPRHTRGFPCGKQDQCRDTPHQRLC
jgi:hypothetical protein